jgi:hypothetical protein
MTREQLSPKYVSGLLCSLSVSCKLDTRKGTQLLNQYIALT